MDRKVIDGIYRIDYQLLITMLAFFLSISLALGAGVQPAQSLKNTVLVFLSTRCPCSQAHESELVKLAADFPEKKFLGIVSNKDESAEDIQEHFSKIPGFFSVQKDTDQRLASRFRALKTPHSYILGAQEEVLYQGGISDSHELVRAKKFYLRLALQNLKRGEKPNPSITKTLGCVISR